ncbi:MAG: SatD family protein [Aeromicrobium sp.]
MAHMSHGYAVIVDLVGSRAQPDRAVAQDQLETALAEVNDVVGALQPLAPTIGDECQGAYADLPSALRAALLLRLVLPEGLDCRFGIGAGTWQTVGRSDYGPMQDGPGWWSAREAIVEAKTRETRRNRTLRSWYAVADDAVDRAAAPSIVNALLLCRDEIVTSMGDRSRRLLLGLLRGRTQVELADDEGISQSAVSQNLRRSGALTVLSADEVLG